MQWRISAMDVTTAAEIIHWYYPPPYTLYNIDGDESEIDSMLDGYHFAVRTEQDELVGFFCFGLSAQVPGGRMSGIYDSGRRVLDIGLGMRPDLTGKGLGQSFVQAGIDFAINRWRPAALRLTVVADNYRAITVYERLNFNVIDRFSTRSHQEEQNFLLMLLPLAEKARQNSRKGML